MMLRTLFVGLLLCSCAGTKKNTESANIQSSCEVVTGAMPIRQAGTIDVKGTLEVTPDLVGKTVFVAVDFTDAGGERHSVAVGSMQPDYVEKRFRCQMSSPSDAAFWKWLFLSEPQDECGYFTEFHGHYETRIVMKCDSRRQADWRIYRHLFWSDSQIQQQEYDTDVQEREDEGGELFPDLEI